MAGVAYTAAPPLYSRLVEHGRLTHSRHRSQHGLLQNWGVHEGVHAKTPWTCLSQAQRSTARRLSCETSRKGKKGPTFTASRLLKTVILTPLENIKARPSPTTLQPTTPPPPPYTPCRTPQLARTMLLPHPHASTAHTGPQASQLITPRPSSHTPALNMALGKATRKEGQGSG